MLVMNVGGFPVGSPSNVLNLLMHMSHERHAAEAKALLLMQGIRSWLLMPCRGVRPVGAIVPQSA